VGREGSRQLGQARRPAIFKKLSGIKATVSLPDFLFPRVQLNKGE